MISAWVALVGCLIFMWGSLTLMLTTMVSGWFLTIIGIVVIYLSIIVQEIEKL